MFKLVTKHLFWWPVVVRLPDPDQPGSFTKQSFDMQFEALSIHRAREIDATIAELPPAERDARAHDYLFEIARGWRNIADGDGQDVPFSREIYGQQLAYPWFRDAVLAAYGQATSGQEARLGN